MNLSLILFSALSFFVYGLGCFFSGHLRREFLRYGLEGQRVFVGLLQGAGAVGLLAGLSQPWMGMAAAGGLALMMAFAVIVRIRLRDTLVQTLPAVFYLLLNAYLGVAGF